MFKSIRDFNVEEKRVLVRCDFDVPVDNNGNIVDDFRINQGLPTIKYLIENKAKVVLMGHMGRPDGKVVESLRLDKVKNKLSEYLGISVVKTDDCIGKEVENQSNSLEPGKVMLLENLRFHKEETEYDLKFAKKLSLLGDIYVNDAFADSHRNHISITGICKYLPSAAGLTLQKEIEVLDSVMQNPKEPLVVIIGGVKVEEAKLKLIESFSEKAKVIISGLVKKAIIDKKIKFKNEDKIISPYGNLTALDIDEKTIELFKKEIAKAKTVLWNGPFGKFEDKNYKKGTLEIAKAIIESKAYSVVGGGETIEFLRKEGIISKFSHVSTGGGAMLNYLAGSILPGLKALE
ncbi:MAG: phosphoglycerate kinase [Candidatus Staskawiczbacteria bacterium]|nr:phosphoglycerate kinase [Candidatus Staskawiczbacteria bacterium]MBI3337196.1 phosphoglycerate kinase [Candidatus Staskawiczbacteria bacterium]